MANVVPMSPLSMTVTVNSVSVPVANISWTVDNQVYTYCSTEQTADARSVINMLAIGGISKTTCEISGTFDKNATAANRVIGANVSLWPGTTATGTLAVTFGANVVLSAAVVVSNLKISGDIFGSNPVQYSATMFINGNTTLTNA